MTEWQPIETAPKGRQLILFFPAEMRNGRVHLIKMVRVDWFPVTYPRQPTHWLPVPKDPIT